MHLRLHSPDPSEPAAPSAASGPAVRRLNLLLTYGGARSILEPLRKLSGLEVEQKNYMT